MCSTWSERRGGTSVHVRRVQGLCKVVIRDKVLFLLGRMSSTIFPWCTEYNVTDLPDYGGIRDALKFAGDLARACVPPSLSVLVDTLSSCF